eukprot:3299511-Rhodomonas_salina.1
MHVDRNQRLDAGAIELGQVGDCHCDEVVEDALFLLRRLLHARLVHLRAHQRVGRPRRPVVLQRQNAHLRRVFPNDLLAGQRARLPSAIATNVMHLSLIHISEPTRPRLI